MPSTRQILDSLGDYLDGKIVDQLVSGGKFASSELLNSITHEVRETLEGVEIVGEMVYYGQYVISGRPSKKQKPSIKGIPIVVLVDWLRLKGLESDLIKARSIAFAIQYTVLEEGIEPFPFIESAIRESIVMIDRAANEAWGEKIERELDIIFKIL